MSSIAHCDGPLVQASYGGDPIEGVVACPSGWVVSPYDSSTGMSQDELLNQALSKHLLSREDFMILSAWVLAIMIAAMGLRLVLKTLNIGEKTNEKN